MSTPIELRALFERTPINRLLGLQFRDRGPGRAEVALPLRPDFLQEEGRIHGGVLSTLADTAAVYVLAPEPPGEHGFGITGVEFKLNFVAAVDPAGAEVVATALLVKRGRTIGLVDVQLAQNGRLVAKGLFTYLFLDRERPGPAFDPERPGG